MFSRGYSTGRVVVAVDLSPRRLVMLDTYVVEVALDVRASCSKEPDL